MSMRPEISRPNHRVAANPRAVCSSTFRWFGFGCAALLIVAGCSVGPDYHRPASLKTEPVPSAFAGPAGADSCGEWKAAEPAAHLPGGAWWQVFGDTELGRLELLAVSGNQNLAAAAARLEQSRAELGIARSD